MFAEKNAESVSYSIGGCLLSLAACFFAASCVRQTDAEAQPAGKQRHDGERCTFDDLSVELCGRQFRDSCCAGSHILFAAMVLYRADLQEPILSPPVRARLREYLRQALDVLVTAQSQDGSWGLGWYTPIPGQGDPRKGVWSPPDFPEKRLLATSHLAEWILYLPGEFDPPNNVLRKAGTWLLRYLEARDNARGTALCPSTHAVGVLECLSQAVTAANTL